jgi:hypothetical protein
MSRYGTVINDLYSAHSVREMYSDYFENPVLTKTRNSDVTSVYMVGIQSGFVIDKKYLIAITDRDDSSIGTKKRLIDIPWLSLQTRMIKDSVNCGVYSYSVKKIAPFTDRIVKTTAHEGGTDYYHDKYPNTIITLLNTESNVYPYPSTGTITKALETYKTVVVITNE